MKVLIVDDEIEILNNLAEAIEDEFFCEVDKATNGLDAFLLCKESEYSVIITDHKMPYMTGAALISALKTRTNLNTKTPVVMISAYSSEGLEAIPELKGVAFVKKPFRNEDVLSAVRPKLS